MTNILEKYIIPGVKKNKYKEGWKKKNYKSKFSGVVGVINLNLKVTKRKCLLWSYLYEP